MFWTAVLYVPACLYAAIRVAQWQQVLSPGPLTWWVPDALAMPVILSLGLIGTRMVTRRKQLRLPLAIQCITLLAVVVLFEGILPQKSNVYTADMVDVGLYALGTAYYSWAQTRLLPKAS